MSRCCLLLVLVGLASPAFADPRAEMATAMEAQVDVRPPPATLPVPGSSAMLLTPGQLRKPTIDVRASAQSSARAIAGQMHAQGPAQQVARQAQAAAATAAGQAQAQAAKDRAAHPRPSPRH